MSVSMVGCPTLDKKTGKWMKMVQIVDHQPWGKKNGEELV